MKNFLYAYFAFNRLHSMMHCRYVALFTFWTIIAMSATAAKALDILIFGGNGFIGGHTSEQLLADGHQLTLINRNHWSWDLGETVKPKVHAIVRLDRESDKGLEIFQREILDVRNGRPFDVVIDFSAYNLHGFRPFYDRLKTLCKLYIYISTDSVYEVCDPAIAVGGDVLLEESQSVRPRDESSAEQLNKRDKYGHKKLQIEEYLMEQRATDETSCPFLILRLPDVLGERDSTQRWWKYQLWLQSAASYLDTPVAIPNVVKHLKTSYVYVKDVARFISHALKRDTLLLVKDKVYNLAYPEPRSLRELLQHIRQAARFHPSEFSSTEDGTFYFPSVTRGALNVSRLQQDFPDFNFSPWTSMVHDVAKFYEKAFLDYPLQRDSIANDLCRDLGVSEQRCKKYTTRLLVEAEKIRKNEL